MVLRFNNVSSDTSFKSSFVVGSITLLTLPSGGLLSVSRLSGPSNSSVNITEGSFGDPPLVRFHMI